MKLFCKLTDSNVVENLILVNENKEISWLENSFGGKWMLVKQGQNLVDGIKNEPSNGSTYDPELNGFVKDQPFPSWIFNETTCEWEAPTEKPSELHLWNENAVQWMTLEEIEDYQ